MSEEEKRKRQALEDEVRDMRLELQIATQLQGLSNAHPKNDKAQKRDQSSVTNAQVSQQKTPTPSQQYQQVQPPKSQHNTSNPDKTLTNTLDEPRNSQLVTPTKPTLQPKPALKSRRNSKTSEPATPPQRTTPTRSTKSPIPANNPPAKTKSASKGKEKTRDDVPAIKLHSKMFANVKQQE